MSESITIVRSKPGLENYFYYYVSLRPQTYEALRPRFPQMLSVLRAIPDVDAHELQRLDERLTAAPTRPNKIDKAKRDLFKKIITPVSIGWTQRNQYYKYESVCLSFVQV